MTKDELMFPTSWPECPKLQNMLPSRAKQVLIEHFLHVMESSPLGFSGNTSFTFFEAMATVYQLHDEWVRKIAPICYDEALKLFKAKKISEIKSPRT
ncbi:MAG: hypothetical protein WCY09_08895 [Candidatus Omnitrophota bacterium]